ncbi:MAG: HAMP domain-containing sensor histidine kinase [Aquabacterium sp.]|uniref:sensor histidine kinase n=1 Tax=Aquabacterium sp. TaxID=1872578 RepID=UPI003BB189DC
MDEQAARQIMMRDLSPQKQDAFLAALIQICASVLILAYWSLDLYTRAPSLIARVGLPWLCVFFVVSAGATWWMPGRLNAMRVVVLSVLFLYFEVTLALALFVQERVDLKWVGLIAAALPLLYVASFALLIRRGRVFPVLVAIVTIGLCAASLAQSHWQGEDSEEVIAVARLALIQPMYLIMLIWIDRQRRRRIAVQYEALGSRMTMLAMITHELRTPLQVISVAAEGLAKGANGAQLSSLNQKFLNRIRSSTAKLNARLRDLIVITKHASGLSPAVMEPFNVPRLINVLFEEHQAAATEKGNELKSEVSVDCLDIRGDMNRMHQILSNLIGNAVKYTNSGVVLVKVSRHPKDGKHGTYFVVEDSGIGIDADQIERIWEPYVRITNDPNVALNEGSGLGLSVVRLLVEMLGGKITVESTPGKGTIFTVWMPLLEP